MITINDENFIYSNSLENCYHCMIINGRHENVIQYRDNEGTFSHPLNLSTLRLDMKCDIAGFLQK